MRRRRFLRRRSAAASSGVAKERRRRERNGGGDGLWRCGLVKILRWVKKLALERAITGRVGEEGEKDEAES